MQKISLLLNFLVDKEVFYVIMNNDHVEREIKIYINTYKGDKSYVIQRYEEKQKEDFCIPQ